MGPRMGPASPCVLDLRMANASPRARRAGNHGRGHRMGNMFSVCVPASFVEGTGSRSRDQCLPPTFVEGEWGLKRPGDDNSGTNSKKQPRAAG